jgi:hypothetical protein
MQKYKAILVDQEWNNDYLAKVTLKKGTFQIYQIDSESSMSIPGWFHKSGLAKSIYNRPHHGMAEDFASQCVWLLSDEEYNLIKELITEFTEIKINKLCNKAKVKITER